MTYILVGVHVNHIKWQNALWRVLSLVQSNNSLNVNIFFISKIFYSKVSLFFLFFLKFIYLFIYFFIYFNLLRILLGKKNLIQDLLENNSSSDIMAANLFFFLPPTQNFKYFASIFIFLFFSLPPLEFPPLEILSTLPPYSSFFSFLPPLEFFFFFVVVIV